MRDEAAVLRDLGQLSAQNHRSALYPQNQARPCGLLVQPQGSTYHARAQGCHPVSDTLTALPSLSHPHRHTLTPTITPCLACVHCNRSPAKPAAKPRATPSKGT